MSMPKDPERAREVRLGMKLYKLILHGLGVPGTRKGKVSGLKGKTYIEIHGEKRAAELVELRVRSGKNHRITDEGKASISRHNTGKTPRKGSHQSAESKQKMSIAKKALIASGTWHPPNDKKGRSFEDQYGSERALEITAKASATMKKIVAARPGNCMHPWTPESRKKLADSCLENVLTGKTAPHLHRFKAITKTIQTVKGGKVKCQGSWEKIFVDHLEIDESVIAFEKDKIRLPYVLNNENYVYIVDFLVTFTSEKRELVEVKPANLTETEENKAKFAAARKWCEENSAIFVIITEKEIAEINGGKLP